MSKEKKCIAIQVQASLAETIDRLKEHTRMSKNALLIDLLEKGLKTYGEQGTK